MFQYHNKEGDLSRCSNEKDDEDLLKKPKKGKKGRRGQWTEHLGNDLVDIILDNDKYKEKPLLTNAKNIKNGEDCHKVIEELKESCSERGEELTFNVKQTRQKFKRCINICRDAVMKIKTSDIKHFQQGKEIGSWLGKLLAVLSSMDICQPQEAIEPGRKAPETNGEEANPEESIMMMFVKKRQVKALPQGLLMRHQVQKGNMYLHQRVEKNLEGKLRVS